MLSMLKRAKARARAHRLPFNLTPDDVTIPATCPVLGITLRTAGIGGADDSPSLDRIVPQLGYVPGNVAVISNLANRIKSNANPDQIAAVARWAATLVPHCTSPAPQLTAMAEGHAGHCHDKTAMPIVPEEAH